MAYLKAERVSIIRVTPDHCFGLVRDGNVEFETHLSREEGVLRRYCTCPQGSVPEAACKHLWATILAVDEGGYVSPLLRAGQIPPFVCESKIPESLSEAWGELGADEDDDDEAMLSSTRKAPIRPALEIQPRLPQWQLRLVELKKELRDKEAVNPSTVREREIHYEIDPGPSRESGQLVVQVSQRQRRTNGQWGKLKPLKLRSDRLDEIEHEDDRQILAVLSGGVPERTNWYAQQAEMQSAVHRFHVPYELCGLLLPKMCATGRVRYLEEGEKVKSALTWDDNPPWELSAVFRQEQSENGQENEDGPAAPWKLQVRLHRGEETLALEEAELVVPGGLVLTKTRIARMQDFGAFDWIRALTSDRGIRVPEADRHAFIDQLLDMPVLPRLELPEELRLQEIEVQPVPHLTVKTPGNARWQMERVCGEVTFDYLGTAVRGSSVQWAVVRRDEGRCLIRDRAFEDQNWILLQELGFRRLVDQQRGGHDVELPARELGPAVRQLIGRGWQVRADGKSVRQPAELQFRIQSGLDWFELHATVDFEGRTVGFPELLSALARGDSTIRLDDGSLGIIPDDWAKRYGLLAGLGVADEQHLRFSHSQVALLDAMLASQQVVSVDEEFARIREELMNFRGIKTVTEPENFHGELRGYQRDGLGWLQFLQAFRLGGCLADDMGLGKTVQLLAMLLQRKQQRKQQLPSLVVVPKSLLFNWKQEATRFTPELRAMEYTGLERSALREQFPEQDLVLTTYGTLRRDIFELKDMAFDYVVLDEAQTIKNSGSQVAKASRLLKANHRLAMSGTPIENHLGDLWSIFEFLNPGMLGRSSIFKSYAADIETPESRKLLSQAMRPFILRRTKKQVASELPEKFEQTILCNMGKEQKRLYAELRDHYRLTLLGLVEKQGLAKSKMHVLEALLRLRQAACHPALLDRGAVDDPSAKLDVLIPQLEQLLEEGHKALIFSQFTSMLSIVRKQLDDRKMTYEYLDGQTRNRKENVERFQNDPDCKLFLISLKAGGLGLNLTAADYVFILDPWWNPAAEAQAIDRAHRVGQTKQVFAYRLICRDTVEEKIAQLQSKKRVLAEAILEADGSLMSDLSTDDLELLLS